MIQDMQIALMAMIIGYVYAAVLIQPGELLHGFYTYLRSNLVRRETVETQLPEELQVIGYKKQSAYTQEILHEHWLLKPLGGCIKCTSGQLSLWLFLGKSILEYYYYYDIYSIKLIPVLILFLSAFIHLIFCICLTILLSIILQRILSRL